MNRAVRLTPEAENDLADAAHWYNTQVSGLGHDFLDEALKAFATIGGAPRQYPAVHKNIHRMLMRRFPFGVFYLVERDQIAVLAVMHASRDPKQWQRRR